MDWKHGKITGLEVLDAKALLYSDLLAQAGPPGMTPQLADDPRGYQHDAHVLAEIGHRLTQAPMPQIEVRLPKHLAQQAVAAWERDGNASEQAPESDHQRTLRHHAGTLALIGLAITQNGRWDGEEMVVGLDPALIGMAITAADHQPPALDDAGQPHDRKEP